jgi:dihydrofolate reductase
MIIGIVAVARDMAIGRDGKLPWHYPSDLKFFKRTTVRNTVVMGSNTWRSIGKPLPDRLNIVLSRSANIELHPDVVCLRRVGEVISLSHYLRGDVFIIGGAGLFKSFADIIDEWLVTDIPIDVPDADTFMPPDFLNAFTFVECEDVEGLSVRRLRRNEGQCKRFVGDVMNFFL